MNTLSYDQAIAEISKTRFIDSSETQVRTITKDEIRDIVSRIDLGDSQGKTTILYSGMHNELYSGDVANNIYNSDVSKYRIIDDTDAFKFLNNDTVKEKILEALGTRATLKSGLTSMNKKGKIENPGFSLSGSVSLRHEQRQTHFSIRHLQPRSGRPGSTC